MLKTDPIEVLESGIRQYYERYSAKKVAVAAFLIGFFSIGLSLVAYVLSGMPLVAILVFAVAGFLSTNLTMLFVVPPSKKIADSCDLICSAIRDPSRIKSSDKKGVILADDGGKERHLKGHQLVVWNAKVVPYFMERQSAGQSGEVVNSEGQTTASERKYIDERRLELTEIEKRVDQKRDQLEKRLKELEKREAELKELEKSVMRKCADAGVESTEDLKLDTQSDSSAANS